MTMYFQCFWAQNLLQVESHTKRKHYAVIYHQYARKELKPQPIQTVTRYYKIIFWFWTFVNFFVLINIIFTLHGFLVFVWILGRFRFGLWTMTLFLLSGESQNEITALSTFAVFLFDWSFDFFRLNGILSTRFCFTPLLNNIEISLVFFYFSLRLFIEF